MPCINLRHAPTCGISGTCFDDGNSSYCVCDSDSGLTQSPEFAYFNPDGTVESGGCFYNENYFRAVFVLIVLLGCIYLCILFFLIDKRSKLRRASPDIFSFGAIITASIIRLSSKDVFFGDHVAFTLLLCWAFASQHIGMTIFYFRYLKYMYNKMLIIRKRERMESKLKLLHVISYCLILVDATLFNVWGILALQKNVKMKLAGLRIIMSYHICRSFFNAFLTYYLYGEMIRDMSSIVNSKAEDADFVSPSSQNGENFGNMLAKALPKAKTNQNVVTVFCIFVGILGIPFLTWNLLTQVAAYPLYTFWVVWPCLHVFIFRSILWKKLTRKFETKPAASSFYAATSALKTKIDDNATTHAANATTVDNIRYFEKTEMEPSTFNSSRMSF